MNAELYQVADELRAIANLGLHFCENGYDRERYEHVLQASARLLAAVEGGSVEEIQVQYQGNLGHFSPLPAVEAAVFRAGKVLLIRRQDNGLWALPGGLVEVGETLAQAAERELWEEAGVRGQASKLLGIFDSRLWGSPARLQLYGFVFQVESQDEPALHTPTNEAVSPRNEVLDIAFYGEDELPPLSPGHDLRVPLVFRLARGEVPVPFFDR